VYRASERVFGNQVKEAYLYGSYARGDYHAESDTDILLIVDLAQETISEYRYPVGLITSDLSLKHDVTVK